MNFPFRVLKSWDLKSIFRIKNTVIVSIVLIFCVVDIYPKLWSITALSQQIETARERAPVLTPEEKKKQEEQLQLEVTQTAREILWLQQRTQDITGNIHLLRDSANVTLQIEDLAANAKVELTSVKPFDQIVRERYVILPLGIGLRGEHAALVEFLARVEKSAEGMSVQKVAVRKGTASDVSLEVELKLYILLPNDKGPGAASDTGGSPS